MFRKPALRGVRRPSMFRKQDTRELAFWNLVPEHEMAVAPHHWGPNEKLMVPFNRGTDALWGYLAVGPRLLALVLLFQLKHRRTLRTAGWLFERPADCYRARLPSSGRGHTERSG